MNDSSDSPKSIVESLKKIAATVKTGDLEIKEQLSTKIWEISEAGYCALWAMNIEFYLWKIVLDGSETEFGAKTITEQEIANLRTLAEQSGGWWHWSSEENKAVFITLDEWQETYQQFLEKQSI